MYSILPVVVAALFLACGLYVAVDRGRSRITDAFLLLCLTTAVWQGTWAVLFQVHDPETASVLVRLGYLFILFLPTTLYQFLAEIAEVRTERPYVRASYALACGLAVVLVTTDLFVAGYYEYSWGYYPKAGPWHWVHMLQTSVVVLRGLHLTLVRQAHAPPLLRTRLQLCIASMFVYFFAATDYLCNYGVDFYPIGVLFNAASLAIIVVAILKYDLMNSDVVVATAAHEVRTPLATIRLHAAAVERSWPDVLAGYQLAVDHGLCAGIPAGAIEEVGLLPAKIAREVDRSNMIVDLMVASSRLNRVDETDFAATRALACIREAIETYPYGPGERERVRCEAHDDFVFFGSHALLVNVLFNLMKNALHAIKLSGQGDITFETRVAGRYPCLIVSDTGPGVARHMERQLFHPFATTKKGRAGGLGLAFSRSVMRAFGGTIGCTSQPGRTVFTLRFPRASGTRR